MIIPASSRTERADVGLVVEFLRRQVWRLDSEGQRQSPPQLDVRSSSGAPSAPSMGSSTSAFPQTSLPAWPWELTMLGPSS